MIKIELSREVSEEGIKKSLWVLRGLTERTNVFSFANIAEVRYAFEGLAGSFGFSKREIETLENQWDSCSPISNVHAKIYSGNEEIKISPCHGGYSISYRLANIDKVLYNLNLYDTKTAEVHKGFILDHINDNECNWRKDLPQQSNLHEFQEKICLLYKQGKRQEALNLMKQWLKEDNLSEIFDHLINLTKIDSNMEKAFLELTGISLPIHKTHRKERLIEYFGEKYTEWQGRLLNNRVTNLEENWQRGEYLNGEDFVFLCEQKGLVLHPRTKGYIYSNVSAVNKYKSVTSYTKSNNKKLFEAIQELNANLAS